MKPIGTITVYFPHIDEETRSTLHSVMDEAENYADFVEKLCDKVCNEESSPLVEYFAALHAYRLDNYVLFVKLQAAGKISELATPLFLLTRARRGERVTWDEMRKAQMTALELAPNDWIAILLYLAWRGLAESLYPESDVNIRPIETISSCVYEDSDLTFFKSYLEQLEAQAYLKDYKRKESISHLKQALAIARKFDEQLMVADLLIKIADLTKHTDVKQAIDLFISSQNLSKQLGYKHGIGLTQHHLGHIMGLRGEFDAAIDHQLEYRAVRESLGLPVLWMNSIIAFYYNQVEDGEKSYQFAKVFLDYDGLVDRYLGYAKAQAAWSLINLDRLDEAKEVLADAKEIVLKSGDSRQIMHLQVAEGVLEREEKNYDIAITCFEYALDYLKENPVPLIQNICLLNLTKIEIELLPEESIDAESDTSGPWMQRLMEYVEKNDWPGIAAQASLLKAKLRAKQGKQEEVRKILKEVKKIAESPSMKYLNDMVISMFPDIIIA